MYRARANQVLVIGFKHRLHLVKPKLVEVAFVWLLATTWSGLSFFRTYSRDNHVILVFDGGFGKYAILARIVVGVLSMRVSCLN